MTSVFLIDPQQIKPGDGTIGVHKFPFLNKLFAQWSRNFRNTPFPPRGSSEVNRRGAMKDAELSVWTKYRCCRSPPIIN